MNKKKVRVSPKFGKGSYGIRYCWEGLRCKQMLEMIEQKRYPADVSRTTSWKFIRTFNKNGEVLEEVLFEKYPDKWFCTGPLKEEDLKALHKKVGLSE